MKSKAILCYSIAQRLPRIFWFCFILGLGQSLAGPLDTLHDQLLRPNGIRWSDLGLQAEMKKPPQFRLKKVEKLLQQPFVAQEIGFEFRQAFGEGLAHDLKLDSVTHWLELVDSLKETNPVLPWKQELASYAKGLSDREWEILRTATVQLFWMHPDDTLLDAVTQEKQRLRDDATIENAYRLAQKLSFTKLLKAGIGAKELQLKMRLAFNQLGPKKAMPAIQKLAEAAGLHFHTGNFTNEEHWVESGVWYDPGGDDIWRVKGKARPGQILIIFDAQGDDRYISKDTVPTASNWGGIFLVEDVAGDDEYDDKGFGFGAGLFGLGLIRDAKGDDRYFGGCATQGFGFFGVGVVQDFEGNDIYSASLFAQGAASTRGFGLLIDAKGNDSYSLRPVITDDLRYQDHFLSMGQGFATGIMQGPAGGIGVLWDATGHDIYSADIFAQGSGYWHSMGLLLDDAGSDRYLAHQYAQGAGVHEAVGLLQDSAGDDRYYSKGVSQGCGHDRGFGWLYDAKGNDLYSAADMSQGGGSANGLGLLIDSQGDDAYMVTRPQMVLGHGDMRRDRGSFGFFFDSQGQDIYPAEHKNGEAWRVFRKKGRGNGYGLDR